MNKQELISELEWSPRDFNDVTGKYVLLEDVIEIINKHLPDNEVSVPAEPTEAMIEAGKEITAKDFVLYNFTVERIYKAMLQAHKGEGDDGISNS